MKQPVYLHCYPHCNVEEIRLLYIGVASIGEPIEQSVHSSGRLDSKQHANAQAMDITCVTGGMGQLVFGDSEGGITISNQNYSLSRFKAHDGCINGAVLVGIVFSR